MIRFAILMILSGGTCATAQVNLVRNGSFEELKWPDSEYPCPTSGGAIGQTKFWTSGHGSVDYYNACSNEEWPKFGVPVNRNGIQRPYDGLAYALIAGYYEPWSGTNAREFLMQELEDSLKEGVGYHWSVQVSLADSSNFAQSSIGVKFSVDDTRYWQIDDFMSCTPDVINPYDNLLDDKIGWTKIQGYFVAHGGERFMSIGLFRSDDTDNIQRVDSIPLALYNWDVAAYYLDAVELYEISGVGVEEQLSMNNGQITIWPNPTHGPATLQYNTTASGPLQWQVCDMAGRTVHTQNLQGTQGRATLGISLPSGMYVSNLMATGTRIGSTRLVVL